MPPSSRKRPARKATDQRNRLRRGKPKFCTFCASHAEWVDYKDINTLRRFMSDRGKIKSRGSTGTCAQHQRDVATAIKTARELALLPYVVRAFASDKPGGRGGRGSARGGRPSPEGMSGAGRGPAEAETAATPPAVGEAEGDRTTDGGGPEGGIGMPVPDLDVREDGAPTAAE